jgi:hypothetical protein
MKIRIAIAGACLTLGLAACGGSSSNDRLVLPNGNVLTGKDAAAWCHENGTAHDAKTCTPLERKYLGTSNQDENRKAKDDFLNDFMGKGTKCETVNGVEECEQAHSN